MSLKVNLSFCIIFVLWTLVSANHYITHGDWRADVRRTYEGVADSKRVYTINDPAINNLGYDFFNMNTIVTVGGNILLKVDPPEAVQVNSLVLNTYYEESDIKTYKGEMSVDSIGVEYPQIAKVEITMEIPRNGSITILNYVYVKFDGCCTKPAEAYAHLHTLKISN